MTLRSFIINHLQQGNTISIIDNEHDTIIYNGAVANVPNYLAAIAEVDTATFARRHDNMGNDIIITITTK